MKGSKQIGLLIMTIVAVVRSIPSGTESRSTTPYRDRRRITDNELSEIKATTLDLLDVRTPPRIKEQQKQILKHREEFELSHAGIAIPVDENSLMTEATTKLENAHNFEHPTTADDAISTSWILLSSLSSTTSKPLKSNNVTSDEKKWTLAALNTTKPKRITSPHFKKRVNIAVTEKPLEKISTESTTVKLVKDAINLTKVKASDLNRAVIKKNSTRYGSNNVSSDVLSTQKEEKGSHITSSTIKTITAEKDNSRKNVSIINTDTSKLPAEAKIVETELDTTVKKKNNSTKRKKNKNRRRKPTEAQSNTTTTVSKPTKTTKQKPITTQIYSYLSREVIPTVGVGLVGLMVTAGLASYFFYPFGVARRSYEVDRKDYYGDYYYKNELALPEEEAIGKVIAGMSMNSNTLYPNSLQKSKNKQDHQSNVRYRFVDKKPQVSKAVQGSVEDVPLTYNEEAGENNYYNNYQTIDYSVNSNENKLFVSGPEKNKSLVVTPVSVPEHGPRDLKDEATNPEHDVPSVTQVSYGGVIETGDKELNMIRGPRHLDNSNR